MLEQLIVLGQIPGTNIQFSFGQFVIITLSLAGVAYTLFEIHRMQAKPTDHAFTKTILARMYNLSVRL